MSNLAAMILGLAFLLATASPASVGAAPPRNEIVVKGVSLQSLEDELARCVASHCPARADVIASVRYAEGLFRSSRYEDARRVLQRAIDRDKGAGKDDPDAVSALYEATATVARHEGEQAVVAAAVGSRLRLLRAMRPADSPDVLRAEIDLADLTLARSSPQAALSLYHGIVARAAAAGQPAVAAIARLRIAQVQHQMHEDGAAARTLDGIIADGDRLAPGLPLAAYAMKTRLDHRRGDGSAVDALRAALARSPQPVPILLSAPSPPRPSDPVDLDYFDTTDRVTRSGDVSGLRWADVGISINPDGTVEAAEELRGTLSHDETAAIAAAVAKRIYAPFPAETGAQYRIERWTLTADCATPIGSLIRRRSVNPHFEVLDITTGGQPAARSGAAS